MKNLKLILKHSTHYLFILSLAVILTACGNDDNGDVKEEPKELNTDLTDELTLDVAYEGKVFQTDRIGEVTLDKCTDGDTANFISNGESITVRFLDVDTPETKGQLDPWGIESSELTCDKLTNAETIVLEGRTIMKDTYDRYLGYIWYDGRLLNLELVEQAYSKAGISDQDYGDLFRQAEDYAKLTKRRIHGEKDPNYHYGTSTVTLEELRTNIEDYVSRNVEFTGIVTRELGENAFIESEGYGIYIYTNYNDTSRLTVGNEVTVKGTVSEYNGAYQIIGVTRTKVTVISEDNLNQIIPNEVNIADLNKDLEGSLLKLSNLKVKNVSTGDSVNIYVEDRDGNETIIRIDKSAKPNFTNINDIKVGKTINVVAPLSEFHGDFQLMLCSEEDIVIR